MYFGILKNYIPARGFGFIWIPNKKGSITKYFLHKSKIISGIPVVGSGVQFEISREREGESPSAINAPIGPVIPMLQQQAAYKAAEAAGANPNNDSGSTVLATPLAGAAGASSAVTS